MADPHYVLDENPVYDEKIRALQISDPGNAETAFNPVLRKMLNNTHFAKKGLDAMKAELESEGGAAKIKLEDGSTVEAAIGDLRESKADGSVLGAHVGDARVHVTQEEKEKWDAVDAYTKEETLTEATRTALGLSENAVPDEAFAAEYHLMRTEIENFQFLYQELNIRNRVKGFALGFKDGVIDATILPPPSYLKFGGRAWKHIITPDMTMVIAYRDYSDSTNRRLYLFLRMADLSLVKQHDYDSYMPYIIYVDNDVFITQENNTNNPTIMVFSVRTGSVLKSQTLNNYPSYAYEGKIGLYGGNYVPGNEVYLYDRNWGTLGSAAYTKSVLWKYDKAANAFSKFKDGMTINVTLAAGNYYENIGTEVANCKHGVLLFCNAAGRAGISGTKSATFVSSTGVAYTIMSGAMTDAAVGYCAAPTKSGFAIYEAHKNTLSVYDVMSPSIAPQLRYSITVPQSGAASFSVSEGSNDNIKVNGYVFNIGTRIFTPETSYMISRPQITAPTEVRVVDQKHITGAQVYSRGNAELIVGQLGGINLIVKEV